MCSTKNKVEYQQEDVTGLYDLGIGKIENVIKSMSYKLFMRINCRRVYI